MSRSKVLAALAGVSALAVFATGVTVAQNADIIKQRREAMRTIAGASTPPFKMTKGDTPFDLAAVQNALKVLQAEAAKFRTLFPDDSKTGPGTDAPARIWTDRAGFNAAIDKWIADATATAAAIKDEATFKEVYPKFAGGCNNCHKSTDGFAISLQESFKKPRP